MAKPIIDTVNAQLYGDMKLQDQILLSLEDAGLNVSVKSEKDYETKKGESGHYRSIKISTN